MARTQTAPQIEYTPAQHMAQALMMAQINTDNSRRSLVEKLNHLRHQIDGVLKSLERGHAPNSLGEIQGQASKIDAGCGELSAVMDAHKSFEQLAAKLGLA